MHNFEIPNKIRSFLVFMENHGFHAYLVGGCVRDGLQGMNPNDWDICTNARPQELQTLFPDALTYGMRHGTVTVRWQSQFIEVTTFRTEGNYSDHRRPDQVVFVDDLSTDLARRDFTINAIAMDAAGNLYDPFGGIRDLKRNVIRAVGNAETRFQEDALRMFRAIRFSAQLGFEIEAETKNAIFQCASLAASLSSERIALEIEKTLLTSHPEYVSDMITAGLLAFWDSAPMLEKANVFIHIPSERIRRWCGFSLLFDQPTILNHLRLDRKTISVSETCFTIRDNLPRDAVFWKQAISLYGKDNAAVAADVISAFDSTNDADIFNSVLQSGDCCTVSDLSVHGDDLHKLGIQGKTIGDALEYALQYVWYHPEKNEREHLLAYLKEEYLHG